jgi:hypothetical protein
VATARGIVSAAQLADDYGAQAGVGPAADVRATFSIVIGILLPNLTAHSACFKFI